MATPNTELCEGLYRAQQIPGAIVVFANGSHRTSGYTVGLQQSAVAVFPPEFTLWHVRPTGIVLQVLTPFSVQILTKTTATVQHIVVHDSKGRHEVKVEQVQDMVMAAEDPPFPWKEAGR